MDDVELQQWLLTGDRSIRAQASLDPGHAVGPGLLPAPQDDDLVGRILALQGPDGNWGVGVYDGDGWNSTTDALWLLLELRADPQDERVRSAVRRVHDRVRWEARNGGRPFFSGETEACVNGRVAALGAHFGFPDPALVGRLLDEQLPDGGWNCDAPASTRSSFHSTICVLEGLLAFERSSGADPATEDARRRGEEYLLQRRMLRARSSGQQIDRAWSTPHVPAYWCYDALRGLEHLRASGRRPGARVQEAVETIRAARRDDGTWPASPHPGRPVVELEPADAPSRLTTLRARRVLAWASSSPQTPDGRRPSP